MINAVNRRNLLAMGALGLALRPAVAASQRPVVVELFTSQGCSSCPPADVFLGELRNRSNLITLSYHVDYWDYLGWRDTLGNAEYSQRQYDYARARGDGNVYTPQTIINGGEHFVGSQRKVLGQGIEAAATSEDAGWVDIAISKNATDLMIEIGASPQQKNATLWLMAFAAEIIVEIKKGENSGATIAYYNVVRKMVPAANWHGQETKLVLPKDSVIPADCTGCVALLQSGKVGPVIGAASSNVNGS